MSSYNALYGNVFGDGDGIEVMCVAKLSEVAMAVKVDEWV